MEALLDLCDENSELRPYSAEGRVLRGPEEVREHYRRVAEEGTTVNATADHFEEDGDTVTVTGSIRINRGGSGGIVDAQIRWLYVFEDGRLRVAEYGPLSAAPDRDTQESRV
jgi:hypothetical protein